MNTGAEGLFAADLGGMGYASDHDVEPYFREARLMRIAPVSQEMTAELLSHLAT